MNFSELGLKPEILRAVEDSGYTTPTPIQEQAIPYVLQGRDVLGIAQTGTGKTASFTLPMLEMLSTGRARARMPRSLILEPTRELAAQVAESFERYGRHEKLTYALLIGGERFDEQVRKLDRGVDVLVATPGRMLDLFERGKVLLADVKILVIDESDRMLDMGFIPDIERIVGLLPVIRQTLFFSATMPPEVRRLTESFLTNPKQVAVAPPATTADNVDQFVVTVGRADKREALRQLLRSERVRNALVFCNRKRDVGIVFRSLQSHGFNAGQLTGDMVQAVRTETLGNFKRGVIEILVCSDVAARGLDIIDLSHVVNFDVPINAEDYVHRIGRTARAGRSGRAFTLATPEDGRFLAAIGRLIGGPIPPLALDGLAAEPAAAEDTGAKRRGRRRAKPQAPRPKSATPDEAAPDSADKRRGGNRGDRRPESAAPDEAARDPADKRRGGTRGDRRPGRQPARAEPRGPRPGPREEAVVGLGDHTPAFLLRPARRLSAGE
ncbi:MAG: DEAD/DEAH box helicase [Alphaproteobacteria bacterium]